MTLWHWLKNIFKRPMPLETKVYVDIISVPTRKPYRGYAGQRKDKVKKFKKCPTMSKNMYTREEATFNLNRLTTKLKPLRIYPCEYCSTWHLTHKKNGYGR